MQLTFGDAEGLGQRKRTRRGECPDFCVSGS
jgi:hypothetical protein